MIETKYTAKSNSALTNIDQCYGILVIQQQLPGMLLQRLHLHFYTTAFEPIYKTVKHNQIINIRAFPWLVIKYAFCQRLTTYVRMRFRVDSSEFGL